MLYSRSTTVGFSSRIQLTISCRSLTQIESPAARACFQLTERLNEQPNMLKLQHQLVKT